MTGPARAGPVFFFHPSCLRPRSASAFYRPMQGNIAAAVWLRSGAAVLIDPRRFFCYKRAMTVEQFLPALHFGDAVGNSALALHRFLLGSGIESRLVAMTCDECLRDQAVLFATIASIPQSGQDPAFRRRLAADRFFPGTEGQEGDDLSQRHPGAFFCRLFGFFDALHQRRPRTPGAPAATASTCPSAIPPTMPTNCATWASPDVQRLSPAGQPGRLRRRTQPRLSGTAAKRAEEHPVRRPHHAEQEDRGPDQGGFFLQKIHFPGRAPDRGRQYPFPAQVLSLPSRTWPRASS